MDDFNFSDLFCKFMRDMNITMSDVANKTDISYQTVNSWQKGRATPKFDQVVKLCTCYNVSPEYFCGLSTEKQFKSIQYIMEYTGLSEKAIKKVMEINKLCLSENQPNFLDDLLTNKYCTELFYYLCEYLKKPKNGKMNFKNIVQSQNDNSDNMAIIEYKHEFPCKFVKGYYLSELSKILALIDEELNNTNSNFYDEILNTVKEREKNGNNSKKE